MKPAQSAGKLSECASRLVLVGSVGWFILVENVTQFVFEPVTAVGCKLEEMRMNFDTLVRSALL